MLAEAGYRAGIVLAGIIANEQRRRRNCGIADSKT